LATSATKTVLRLAPAVGRDRSTLRPLVHATDVASRWVITHGYPLTNPPSHRPADRRRDIPAGGTGLRGWLVSPVVRLRLYVVHGSHPCAAVEKALSMKGLSYEVTEWPTPLHAPIQRALFGARTVPGLKLDGEKVSGSRAIMRRLDALAPDPPLFPADAEKRAKVEEAERWGDEAFQPVARELIWAGFTHQPGAMVSFGEHSRLPLPASAIRLSAPLIARLGAHLNRTGDEVVRADLEALPAQLDRIDGWIADSTIGDPDHPNAADLQLASTVRLLLTLGDVRPLIEGRPCADLATALFPDADGELPAGSLPVA
jgi:glutathione S-transferase